MARRAARTDGNQTVIVEQLRAHGYSVTVTSATGDGFPDIVIGGIARRGQYQGKRANWLAEIKDPAKPPSKRKLTKDQERWHGEWRGQKMVIESYQDFVRQQ